MQEDTFEEKSTSEGEPMSEDTEDTPEDDADEHQEGPQGQEPHDDPMEVNVMTYRRLPQKEYERCKRLRLCFNCGQPGHKRDECS
jgi:hypothetical protein